MPVYDYRFEIEKHREAQLYYGGEFASHLLEGVSLSADPVVRITIPRIGDDIDVTTEFLEGSPTLSADPSDPTGPQVRVLALLKAAADGEQAPGLYRILFKATGSDGEVHVIVGRLQVRGGGSV